MTDRCLDQRWRRFERDADLHHLENYWNLPFYRNETLHLRIERDGKNGLFYVNYTRYSRVRADFVLRGGLDLPLDVAKCIAEYIPTSSHIRLCFHIHHGTHYPFHPPTWSVKSVTTNLAVPEGYYTYLTDLHNEQYRYLSPMWNTQSWSPGNDIARDVLRFFVRINHFDHFPS